MPASSDDEEASYDEASDDEETSDDEQPLELHDDDSDDGGGTAPPRAVRKRLPKVSNFPADRERERAWLEGQVDGCAHNLQAALADLADLAPPPTITASMRDYQLTGLRWAVALHRCGLSGILGDEMGLGKSLQAIAMLAHLKAADGAAGPFLVVAPLSTLAGWAQQFGDFAPSVRVVTYSGAAAERAAARARLDNGGFDVLLCSYETLLADAPLLCKRHRWSYAVIDEAHRLKNRQAVVYRCLLDECALGAVPRLLLTGTPVQQNADELFALLHFVAPQVYDCAAGFADWLKADAAAAGAASADADADASRLWRPFMLRRLKADHLVLPPKRECEVHVPLTPLQGKWYRAVLERNVAALGAANARGLVNVLAALRKCTNHPYLFAGAEPEPFVEGEHLVDASAKLKVADRLLKRLRARGSRVLLFSQSTQTLDVLQDYLHLRGWDYERLDGSVRSEERWAAARAFQASSGAAASSSSSSSSGAFVFLLSTRAGGVGLNLTAADTVILYDSDWNPQMDRQAVDRAHRLGQTRPVLVVRLMCTGTVEELIARRAKLKARFSDALIAPPDAGTLAAEAVRFGLHHLLHGADNGGGGGGGGGEEPTDEMLDAILDGSSGDGGDAAAAASGGDGGGDGGGPSDAAAAADSIYTFDGEDFGGTSAAARRKADEEAYDELMRGAAAAAANGGGGGGGAGGGEGGGKRRRAMSAEELEEQQREQAAAAAAAAARKRQRATERKVDGWRRDGYASLALPRPAAAAGDGMAAAAAADDDGSDDDDPAGAAALRCVVGDAATATAANGNGGGGGGPKIVLCFVDDSGRWPAAGFFRSLSAASAAPQAAYEAAGTHGDLASGDAHLVECGGGGGAPTFVCLLVVLERPRRGGPPALSLTALAEALPKVAAAAAARHASVHSPRLPGRTALAGPATNALGFSANAWYGVERLLKKHVVGRRVPTTVYYFRS